MSTTTAAQLITGLDPDSDAYWTAIDGGELPVERCLACDTRFLLPLPSCPECGSDDLTKIMSTGTGSLYTWVIVNYAFDEDLAAQTPYVIGAVELDEGARIFARVEGIDHQQLLPDQRLRATFPREPGRPPVVFVPEGSAS